ncbi:exo-alpha-sialidase, partial [bacterium]|nr:exo-alpha-sialidase [bacterium]
MSIRRLFLFLLVAVALLIATGISTKSNTSNGNSDPDIIVGRNVNMVAGQEPIGGDPYLQRQNEPSIAVSTRNPFHLLAGSNDYRAIDYVDSGELPGQDQIATSHDRDTWLGVFKSFNGGQTWITTLLPGCKYNPDDPGTSPLYGYGASADPTVRAGPNGLFYYSGIAFDRIKNGTSVLFVARYTDNNTTKLGDPDTIKYIDMSIIDEGTSGQFADKPWIAVDIPRNLSPPVPIGENNSEIPYQLIPAHNVYIVYSIFLGDLKSKPHNKILFARSTDCGDTWGNPIKLSEGERINQGTTIAVSPLNGDIYVAWRRFKSDTETDAIMVCKSKDYGSTFTKPMEVRPITPFDQFTGNERFRTSAFPTLAVDHAGTVYVAWSDRGFKDEQETHDEFARIVISTSTDGIDWSDPKPIDLQIQIGHQIMPSLAYAAGKLMMTWYDTRNYSIYNNMLEISGEPHTMDVRVAQALPSSDPVFTSTDPPVDSTQVSRYLYDVVIDTGQVTELKQVQFNQPNYEMFVGGTYPFHGDYIDITPAPAFLYDPEQGSWYFNTGYMPNGDPQELSPDIFHVTWTDNRDVIPPDREAEPPIEWWHYRPPYSGCLGELTTGMRNQNIYTAPITQGLMVGAPVNAKPLLAPQPLPDPNDETEPCQQQKVTFLVFAKNLTDLQKYYRLTIEVPEEEMEASFWEEGPPEGDGECPFITCGNTEVDLLIYPHSSITLTVFVAPYEPNPYATFRVKVEEVGYDPEADDCYEIENPLQSYIILNPDPINTQNIPASCEYHTPTLIIEGPVPVILSDPTMLSAQIVYDPYLEELLNYSNPDIVTPGLRHPGLRHDTVINPGLRHTALEDPIPNGKVTDLNWTVTNNTATTSAYSFEPIGELPDPDEEVEYQLLIYRVNTTPATATTPYEDCILSEEEHHELLLTTEYPGLRHPGL